MFMIAIYCNKFVFTPKGNYKEGETSKALKIRIKVDQSKIPCINNSKGNRRKMK